MSPALLRALQPFRLNPRRNFAGRTRGERLTKDKGISIEFADYRDYTYGDDLRHLDWNVLARLETPVIKTYHDEEDLALYILLDCSKSMDFGEPSKFEAAREVALALGFVGLNSQDAVYVSRLGKQTGRMLPFRSRASFGRLSAWTAVQAPEDSSILAECVKTFLHAAPRAGIAALITDGLDPDLPKAISLLGGRGFEVWVVQVLAGLELDPDLEGDLKLIDCESGAEVEITASGTILDTYRQNLKSHCSALADACKRSGGHYAMFHSGGDLLHLVNDSFRREGWVRS